VSGGNIIPILIIFAIFGYLMYSINKTR